VVDSGLARAPRYEPGVGQTRLETVRVSRAAADQRRGRAGRTQPGICYRLWDAPETASLMAFAPPEILATDLSGFMLDLAQCGVRDPAALAFLDAPPAPAVAEAVALLRELGALDGEGRITAEGRRLRQLPLPPRLARMVTQTADTGAGRLAAEIAVVLSERGLGGDDVDLAHRLDSFRRDRSERASAARATAARWAEQASVGARPAAPSPLVEKDRTGRVAGSSSSLSPGALLALAFPGRIARTRGSGGSFLLANGRGGTLDPASSLAQAPYITVAEIVGTAAQSRIVLAAAITLEEIEAQCPDRIESRTETVFDPATASLRARNVRRLGAIRLADAPVPAQPTRDAAELLATGIVGLGIGRLPWSQAVQQWRDRVMFLRAAEGAPWPDLSDAALAASATDWLAPALASKTALAQITAAEFANALEALLPWELRARLDKEAPTHFEAPSGSRVPILYGDPAGPKLAIRVQELFGLARHPAVAGGRAPLVIELLSPAHRPVQVTRDLPGFWRGSYAAVRSEMRGRYPRHPWPDNPLEAPPTRRAKPRGT
jgi:ATP-dependent helicase HrpB